MCDAGMVVICCPFFGYFLDYTRTRQIPYLFGLILLATSMLLLATGEKLWTFLIARLLQGAATAMVCVAGLALITDTFDKDRLGTAIGYLSSATAMGFLLGPSMGGVIYSRLGYEAVFIISSIVIGIDFMLRLLLVEKKVSQRCTGPDTDVSSDSQEETLSNFSEDMIITGAKNVLPKLIKQPRILITLWGLLVMGMLNSAFDAVSNAKNLILIF